MVFCISKEKCGTSPAYVLLHLPANLGLTGVSLMAGF